MKKFYLLWNPCSNLPPKIKFATRKEAEQVADDMARRHSQPFYVLRALSFHEVQALPVSRIVLK